MQEDPDGALWAHKTSCEIWRRLAAREYRGWDPYDALNARLVPKALKRSHTLSRLLIQAVKRCPISLQPIIGVRPQVDAYTLGHVLLAAARLVERPESIDVNEIKMTAQRVVAQLEGMARGDMNRIGWGYHFPMRSRFSFYGPPNPNIIVTAFVSKGLAAITRAGLVDCSSLLRKAVGYVLTDLPRCSDETGQCIKYHPGATPTVHNANLLAAMLLCEAARTLGPDHVTIAERAAWIEEATACARFTVARQKADGSWPYADEPGGEWVDGFHTGFVLEGLACVVRATGDSALRAAHDLGVQYYVAQLFGPEGQPKYHPHRPRPFDALSAAQGVETLQVIIAGTAAQAAPGQLEWIQHHLVKRGRVAYQVHKGWTDWREFPRWAGAPLMSALAGVRVQNDRIATTRGPE